MAKHFLNLFYFFVLPFFLFCCGEDSVPPGGGNGTDPGIYMTDEFGNFLGGDTTDWCLTSGLGSFSFGAAYPNPTRGQVFRVHFQIPSADTVKIYFFNGIDSTVFFNSPVQPGTYQITVNDSTSQFANSYRRLYISSKRNSSSPYCRFYGDIKFEP